MTTAQEEAVFCRQLDGDPTDWGLRMVFADWLGEHGRSREEAAMRWAGLRRKAPHRCGIRDRDWQWIPEYRRHPNDPTANNLDAAVFSRLPDGGLASSPDLSGQVGRYYQTRRLAEAALAEALGLAGEI